MGVMFLCMALAARPTMVDAAPSEASSPSPIASAADPTTVASATDPTPAESPRSLALKLTSGARLVEKADGSLAVVEHWDALSTMEGGVSGLALEESAGLDKLGITVLEPAPLDLLDGVTGLDLESAARRLALMPGVLWAEVSHPVHACLEPNDPMYPSSQTTLGQWGMRRVGLPQAWDITTGSADVILAVIDTGINADIYDFSGRIVSPYSAITKSSQWPAYEDRHGHGTAVAGVAAARGNDGRGMAGAAWNVGIMPVKISESGESDTTLLSHAVIYAADHGADILNVSISGGESSQTLTAAVTYALTRGVVVVAAVGNQGGSSVGYPAAIPGVIAVGATDSSDKRWVDPDLASNMGSDLDLVAPGKLIISYSGATPGSFGYYRGTSVASPLVAGTAALMRSVDPTITSQEIIGILTSTADDLGAVGWDMEYGWGLLDAAEAVARATYGEPTTTTTTTTEPSTTTTTTVVTTTTSLSTTTTVGPTTTTTVGPTTTTVSRFADVNENSTPYWREIEFVASLGIVSGSNDGLFHPQSALLRQQFAKVIVIALDYPVSTADVCPFADVQKSVGEELYPDHYVAVAYKQGITNGTTTTPKPSSPYRTLTRAQTITMVARAAGLVDPPLDYKPPFSNFSSVHYPLARAAAWAGLLDGLVGMGSDYDFLAPANRGEICALVYALLR